MIVVDDASEPSLEFVVREAWPEAIFVRRKVNVGQCECRTEAFGLADGDYVLQIDDDSHLTQPGDLEQLVAMMNANPHVGMVALRIFNGDSLPSEPLPEQKSRYTFSFVGCGVLFRKQTLDDISGYLPFLQNEWEEEELSLRILKYGWASYYWPDVLVHHRLSPQNRRTSRTWMRGFRNKLWAIVMHFPLRRLPLEMTWVLAIASFDAIRLFRIRPFAQGVIEFFKGLPRAWRLRSPMSNLVLRRYDALRFGTLQTDQEYADPPKLGLDDVRGWFRAWLNRPRQRSVWDRRSGDVGQSPTVKYAHEYKQEAVRRRER
jgi:GT2 family glycosyltransferase